LRQSVSRGQFQKTVSWPEIAKLHRLTLDARLLGTRNLVTNLSDRHGEKVGCATDADQEQGLARRRTVVASEKSDPAPIFLNAAS
jgi:hypothetical protein